MKWILVPLAYWSLTACHPATLKNTTPADEATPAPASHLPVVDFLREDIRKVETYAGGLLLKTTRGTDKDSVFINLDRFKKEAAAFLVDALDSSRFQEEFTEMSLMDETSGLLHFIYTPKNPENRLKKIVVYVSPSLTTDKVNRIYMEVEEAREAMRLIRKMTWKMGHYFLIAERRELADSPEQLTLKKVIWDPAYFEEE